MFTEQIEKLKAEYTDRYVVVDPSRPELARFRKYVGRVKTVNMNGRALVQFDGDNHVGWYDIELDFLKVVEPPTRTAAEPKEEQPKAKGAPSKLEVARAEKEAPAAAPAGKGKLSTKDILAAARGNTPSAAAPSSEKPAAEKKLSTAEILAAARRKIGEGSAAPAAEKPAPKPAPAAAPTAEKSAAKPAAKGKLSTSEILALARKKPQEGDGNGAEAAGSAAVEEASAPAAAEKAPAAEKTPAVQEAAPKAAAKSSSAKVDRNAMSVAEKIAWCREHDGK